jgi:hypothetical protein
MVYIYPPLAYRRSPEQIVNLNLVTKGPNMTIADTRFRRWSARGQRIECAVAVLDQISSAAWDGFRRFRHGGMEVGGILVGSLSDHTVRVVNARPIEISYGKGAIFRLTEADYDSLDDLIRQTDTEVALKGLQVIGYYESHTRRDASLEESDLETYDVRFDQPSRVCIVLKPNKESGTIVTVYVRDQRGEIVRTELEGDMALEEKVIVVPQEKAVVIPDQKAVVLEQAPAPVRSSPEPQVTLPRAPEVQPPQYIQTAPAPARERRLEAWMYAVAFFDRLMGATTRWISGIRFGHERTPPQPPNAVPQQAIRLPEPAPNAIAKSVSTQSPAGDSNAKNKRGKPAKSRKARRRK